MEKRPDPDRVLDRGSCQFSIAPNFHVNLSQDGR